MSDVLIASTQADAEAAEQFVEHHAAMSGRLGILVAALEAATSGPEALKARDELAHWAREELLPHVQVEADELYPAAATLPELKVLVEAMIAELQALAGQVDALENANHPVSAISAAGGLRALFESHADKETTLLVPALVTSPDHDVADLVARMQQAGPEAVSVAAPEAAGGCGGGCACGESDGPELPVLDATAIPHAIRHATIFGALDNVQPGGGMVLRAPHDPLPLLAQLEQRAPGAFEISYLTRGPEVWDLQLLRR